MLHKPLFDKIGHCSIINKELLSTNALCLRRCACLRVFILLLHLYHSCLIININFRLCLCLHLLPTYFRLYFQSPVTMTPMFAARYLKKCPFCLCMSSPFRLHFLQTLKFGTCNHPSLSLLGNAFLFWPPAFPPFSFIP